MRVYSFPPLPTNKKMPAFHVLRLAMHASLLVLSVIVLGLGAYLLSKRFYTPGFPVAVSVLTLISLGPM